MIDRLSCLSPRQKRQIAIAGFRSAWSNAISRSRFLSNLFIYSPSAAIIVRRTTAAHSWIRLISFGHILMDFFVFGKVFLFFRSFRLSSHLRRTLLRWLLDDFTSLSTTVGNGTSLLRRACVRVPSCSIFPDFSVGPMWWSIESGFSALEAGFYFCRGWWGLRVIEENWKWDVPDKKKKSNHRSRTRNFFHFCNETKLWNSCEMFKKSCTVFWRVYKISTARVHGGGMGVGRVPPKKIHRE